MSRIAISVLAVGMLLAHGPSALSVGSVTTIADLAVLTPPTGQQTVRVDQYWAGVGGRSATYSWKASSTATPDNCTVIGPSPLPIKGRWFLNWSEKLDVRLCGYRGNGAPGDRGALMAGIAAVHDVGGELDIPPGPFKLDSSLPAITIPSRVKIQCAPNSSTVFELTGTTQRDGWFTMDNPNDTWIMDCSFVGNNVGKGAGASGALLFHGAIGATGQMSNFGCIRCTFANFKQAFWIEVLNESAWPMSAGRFDNVSCYSRAGNMVEPHDIHYPAGCIAFLGQWQNLGGLVSHMVVEKMYVDCTYIKEGAIFWSGVQDSQLLRSRIENCGAHAGDNAAGYGSFAYDLDSVRPRPLGASEPTRITWRDNTIVNPRSAGIYIATADACFIDHNFISGQTDRITDAPNVKGGIAVGGITNCHIDRNTLIDNYHGLVLIGLDGTTNWASANEIRSNVPSATNIIVQSASLTSAATRAFFSDNVSICTAKACTAFLLLTSAGQNLGCVTVSGGRLEATYTDFQSYDGTTQKGVLASGIAIDGVHFGGHPILVLQHIDVATPISIRDATIDATAFTDADHGIVLTGATAATVSNLKVNQ